MADFDNNRVRITEQAGVCVWKTVIPGSELCAICRVDLSDHCLACSNAACDGDANNNKSSSCHVEIGECTHAFHRHCLAGWLERMKVCCLCSSEWRATKVVDRSELL
jgi:hypothetical protein